MKQTLPLLEYLYWQDYLTSLNKYLHFWILGNVLLSRANPIPFPVVFLLQVYGLPCRNLLVMTISHNQRKAITQNIL